MKKAAYGVAGLFVLLVGAALIVPSVIDWNAYKPEIAAEVQKATGRTLDIDGTLEFAVLPTPHLKVSNARLANAPGASASSILSLKELEVSVLAGVWRPFDLPVLPVPHSATSQYRTVQPASTAQCNLPVPHSATCQYRTVQPASTAQCN